MSTEKYPLYIGGKHLTPEKYEPATDPATGETIGHVPQGTRSDVERAIDAAREVRPQLEALTPFERAELCTSIADRVDANRDHLVDRLVADQGKPTHEAVGEVESCAEWFRLAAENVRHDEPPTFPSSDPDKRVYTMRKPHGVVGVITPWNFPVGIPSQYLSAGIAAGNALVWCPAPTTSVVAAELMAVVEESALPDGTVNLVTGDGPVVGDEVVVNDGTDAIGFTGSPETGEQIASRAGAKPTLLEMGGNGPVIVLEDADLEAAARCVARSCFTNAGQICSATERIIVHETVHDDFLDELIGHAADVTVGDPRDETTDMGPLNNETVAGKVARHYEDALEHGAEAVHGKGRADGFATDRFFQPTVLDGVTRDMAVNREETFGPLAPIVTVADREEALAIANDSDYGLISGVFTTDVETMHQFAERIETGIVNVNDASAYWEKHIPFGGYSGKNSGSGRLGGRFTVEELSQLKTVIVDAGNATSSR